MAGGGLVLNLTMLPIVIGAHALIAYMIVARKYGQQRLGITWRQMKAMLHEATPFALFGLLYQFSTRIDVVLLGLMLGAAAAGIYNVGYRVIFLLLFPPTDDLFLTRQTVQIVAEGIGMIWCWQGFLAYFALERTHPGNKAVKAALLILVNLVMATFILFTLFNPSVYNY